MTFRPIVQAAVPERELRWRGRLVAPGLFDGEHRFRLEIQGPGCRFHQGERFTGILVAVFDRGLSDATRRGFEAMNRALEARAEG